MGMEGLVKTQCDYCGADSNGAQYCCSGCARLAETLKSLDQRPSLYTELDLPQIKSHFQLFHGLYDYRLYVEGLHCASCVHLLEKLPEFDSQITEARVDFAHSTLAIKVNASFSLARLIDLLQSWGYKAHFLAAEEGTQQKISDENKALLKKLAVTGACAGNIMLFVIPIYAGLEGVWKTAFNWMSFFLFLPVVLYSGTPFYRGAWNSLRYRTVNVDLPITIALLSGFVLSTINLFRGNGAIYFDSTAGFIFLILCARYYLKRSQQKFLNNPSIGNEVLTDQYRLIEGSKQKTIAAQDISEGDKILLRRGQVCPVDGILEMPGLIDLAVMNGEPLPRRFESGMKILAGSKVLSNQLAVFVTEPFSSTYLSKLQQELREGELSKSNFTSISDKAAQWLIMTVSTTAGIYFLLNYQADFQEAFNRALALIVLACPCALAFGAPLTLNLALRKAQKLGILIKESGTLEKIWHLQNIFFDKTGTLTSLNLTVVRTEPEVFSAETKSIILGLESESYHPIAFAIRDYWSNDLAAVIEDAEENIGIGVAGKFNGHVYQLVQNVDSPNSKEISTTLFKDDKEICSIFLHSPVASEARHCIEQLNARGLESYLVSGDQPAKAKAVGIECGIPEKRIFGWLSPQAKRYLIISNPRSCMIGDGSNDALALQAADVGIAVKGSTYVNLQAADIYFTREGLKPLLDLFSLARLTKKVLLRNLTFAFVYNITGGTLALLGFVNPWLAAVLMPISSVLIISSTLWELR